MESFFVCSNKNNKSLDLSKMPWPLLRENRTKRESQVASVGISVVGCLKGDVFADQMSFIIAFGLVKAMMSYYLFWVFGYGKSASHKTVVLLFLGPASARQIQ